jgi:hypothetical protein
MVAGEAPYSHVAISALICGLTAWVEDPATPSMSPSQFRIAAQPWERPPDHPLAASRAILRI